MKSQELLFLTFFVEKRALLLLVQKIKGFTRDNVTETNKICRCLRVNHSFIVLFRTYRYRQLTLKHTELKGVRVSVFLDYLLIGHCSRIRGKIDRWFSLHCPEPAY